MRPQLPSAQRGASSRPFGADDRAFHDRQGPSRFNRVENQRRRRAFHPLGQIAWKRRDPFDPRDVKISSQVGHFGDDTLLLLPWKVQEAVGRHDGQALRVGLVGALHRRQNGGFLPAQETVDVAAFQEK